MPRWISMLALCVAAVAASACGSQSATPTPTNPSPTPTTPVVPVTTPLALASPASDDQLTTLRPTLTVTNPTQMLAGRTYEFQISDRNDFTVGTGSRSAYYTVNVSKTGVSEGSSTTAYTVEQDLQPATRFYWRARWTQGTTTADWSNTGTFRTQIIGYSQPGELYDPLVNGATVAEFRFKRTTFFPGKGLRIDDSDSYARYGLKQTITDGEFSADIEGISASPVSDNPDTAKLKIFSMCDCTTDIAFSDYLATFQYRGFNGNPPNAISFKMLFGEDDEAHKLEPDLGTRIASVRLLNAGNTYHWKVSWGHFVHQTVLDGGAGAATGIGGNQIYDLQQNTVYTYSPPSHFAYLGVNNSGSESGSWPGAIYRNVWIGNKARPASLGTALQPLK